MGLNVYEIIFLFIVSFVSNATPFFGAPYTIIATTVLLRAGFNLIDYLIVVFVTGLGAGVSKIVMYGIGLGLRKPLKDTKNMKFLARFVNNKSFYVTLFILALLPILPIDDYLFLGGGIVKAPLSKMLSITIISKISKSAIEIALEAAGLIVIAQHTRAFGITEVELGIISSIVFVILGILLFKLDWEKYYTRAEEILRDFKKRLKI
ncbi:MAG: hypothetical protein QXV69_04005 [Sulfolobaceae archaeon]